MTPIPIYLEVGQKRVFAGGVDWPGWCRGGRDEAGARQALVAYAPRYARVLEPAGIPFRLPTEPHELEVVAQVEGNAATDFGAPNVPLDEDDRPLDEAELQRQLTLMQACWNAFAGALRAAEGHTLRTGPRGGGRDAARMAAHVLEAHASYLRRIAWKAKLADGAAPAAGIAQLARETAAALETAVRDGLPAAGPRGGQIWTPRTFTRRAAWHILDHAWEIEDRLT